MKKPVSVFLLALCVASTAVAQQFPQRQGRAAGSDAGTGASAQLPAQPRSMPKPYGEVITPRAKTTVGLFTVHKIEDKLYFEIPDSILGRDILVVSRLSKAGADMRAGGSMSGYAGDEINNNVVRFDRGPNNRIFMRDLSYSERSSDTSQPMYKAVMNSNIQPIALSLDIKAYHTDSITDAKSVVVDMTDAINSDNDIFFFGRRKAGFGIGAYQADKSYLQDVKTFPINTEIQTVKTYNRAAVQGFGGQAQAAGAAAAPTGTFTVEINTSMVLLPKTPMQPRFFDPRVGYFTNGYTDFDANPQGTKEIETIARWRLEPKDEDIEKYKRGELVEPKKPIIIYIDPATPPKWVPYLIQGINDWQAAFEKAGFKNAIIGKRAPTYAEDPTWSLEDARHSAVVYKPSSVENASGPHTYDPRSGEIMETHINWYHNVMKLLHDWYFIQAAAVDPKARKMQFDDELMGQLIRFVSSHEIGHTLGLRHNFGSSAGTPVEKLRDKAWVEEHGHTASIMDYARFNYVAQPGDNISEKGLFPRIGDYDKWAIEWGYRWYPEAKSAAAEKAILNKIVVEKMKDKRNWFRTESDPDDPRAQSEDLGDNAMKASEYGIMNLKRILSNLLEWTKEDNEGYDDLKNMYDQLTGQLNRYVGHVSKNIGGRYEDLKTVEQAGAVYEPVPAATQKEAMAFLSKQVFTTPTWLLDKKILGLIGTSPSTVVTRLQTTALNRLLDPNTMNKLVIAEEQDPQAYTVLAYFSDLNKAIWGELETRQKIDVYRRSLQKTYVEKLDDILHPAPAPAASALVAVQRGPRGGAATNFAVSDVMSVVKAQMSQLRSNIKAALPGITDPMTKYHLQDLVERIDESLKPAMAKAG